MQHFTLTRVTVSVAAVACLALSYSQPTVATQAAPPAAAARAAEGPTRYMVAPGTRATYRVREQLAGMDFGTDASGTTDAVKGSIVIGPDGAIDAKQSRLTVDLKTLTSDHDRRDNFIFRNTLEGEKHPQAILVPKAAAGLKWPLPPLDDGGRRPAGFQLVADTTIRGVTKEIKWNTYVSMNAEGLQGRAVTSFPFATFGLTKPSASVVLGVEDKITLEIDFRLTKAPL